MRGCVLLSGLLVAQFITTRSDDGVTRWQVDKTIAQYRSIHGGERIEWDCDICRVVVGLVQTLAEQEKTWADISKALKYLCIKLKVEDGPVCSGIVPEYEDEVLTVLDHLVLKPSEVCTFTFGDACGTGYDPFKMWNITLPKTPKPPVKPVPPPKKGAPVLRVLHVSDVHVDLQYREGAETDCGEPICCRNTPPSVRLPAQKWGMYKGCDLPPVTLENLFEHLASNYTFDYILWTGDLPAHYVWLSSQADTAHLMDYITQLFTRHFPTTPVYSTLGNHEGVPVNSFPPPDWKVVPKNDSTHWLYESSAKSWLHWLPTETLDTILRGGFYTTLIYPGLRMISLNMNLCNNQNWWLLLNMTDPSGQLQWLVTWLQYAEDHHEKVQLIGHIPPGTTSCYKSWSWNYYRIINRYESTIVGQFYGHSHHDEFEIFYDPASNFTRPTSVAYIGPSVMAGHSGNSGYKIYTIDGHYNGSTSAVLDTEVHVFNLSEANKPGGQPRWFKAYSAKSDYKLKALQPKDWDGLLQRMQHDNATFNQFYTYRTKLKMYEPCDEDCKQTILCGIRSARSYDKHLCQNYTRVYDNYSQYLYDSHVNSQC